MIMQQKAMSLMPTAVIITFIMLIAANQTIAGDLDPDGPPGSTMKTLDEVTPTWSQKLPASERFKLVMGGAAVLDKETGLVWEQSLDTGTRSWTNAHLHCLQREVSNRYGWHLPTAEELASLIDSTQPSPSLPDGHPFNNVQSSIYWSSTTSVLNTDFAWSIYLGPDNVGVYHNLKSNSYYVWCVRGGYGHDAY